LHQGGEPSSDPTNIVLLGDPSPGLSAHLRENLERCRHHLSDCVRQIVYRTGGNQPSVLAGLYQFGYARHVSAEHGTTTRHGFHDDDGQAFREAGQYKSTACIENASDGFAVSPSGYLHTVGQPLLDDRPFNLGTQLSVAHKVQLDAKPLPT